MQCAVCFLSLLPLIGGWRTYGTLPTGLPSFTEYVGKFCFDFKRHPPGTVFMTCVGFTSMPDVSLSGFTPCLNDSRTHSCAMDLPQPIGPPTIFGPRQKPQAVKSSPPEASPTDSGSAPDSGWASEASAAQHSKEGPSHEAADSNKDEDVQETSAKDEARHQAGSSSSAWTTTVEGQFPCEGMPSTGSV
eukprot:symbB.v1.2.033690.t1/scaffold4221.1/size42938/5